MHHSHSATTTMDFYNVAAAAAAATPMPLPVGYLGQPSPPQPTTITFPIVSPELQPLMKPPACPPITMPPMPPPNVPLVLDVPATMFAILQRSPYHSTEDDLVDTCSNCQQPNTLWKLRMRALIDMCRDNSELIDYLKKRIIFRPSSHANDLPASVSNNISYPTLQATADLYKSSNLDANANEFTPSQKSRAAKMGAADISKYDGLDNCEIASQTMDGMDSTAVESGIDSGVHDSGVSDSGVLDTTPVDSVSELCIQSENGPLRQELHHSTESLKNDAKHTIKNKRSKKKTPKLPLETDNQNCRPAIDDNQNYKESKNEQKYGNMETEKMNDPLNSVHRRRGVAGGNDRVQNGQHRYKFSELPRSSKKAYDSSHTSDSRNSPFSPSMRNHSADKYRKAHVESVVREVEGDLFTASDEYSLAHCVAEDFRMSAGIAVQFRKEFGGVGELLDQRKSVGQVAFLKKGDRYIYYLITKRLSHMKPTMKSMSEALKSLRQLCVEHNVKKLAMPVIGCGLDKLNWDEVRNVLNAEFRNTSIDVVVYHYKELESNTEVSSPKTRSLKIKEEPYPLVDIEQNTALVVYGSADGHLDKTGKRLNVKYPFVEKYASACRKQEAIVGEFLPIFTKHEYVCVFIIRKYHSEPFQFSNLARCIQNFNKFLIKENYGYVGVEPVEEDGDSLINDKIITVFRSHLSSKMELYVCNKKKENEGSTSTS